jgi:hypothetical protein
LDPNFRFRAILKVLLAHHVDFIVVGGVSAVLHGSPVDTRGVDVVHSRRPDNIERLQAALREPQRDPPRAQAPVTVEEKIDPVCFLPVTARWVPASAARG